MAQITLDQHDAQAVGYAINQAKQEGWNPGLDDHQTFSYADPNGFFIAKLDGKPIGCAAGICYGNDYAFFGLYVIEKAYRGLGYGMQLTKRRLDYVGDRCTGLDGVLENEQVYAKIGFRTAFISHRYAIKPIDAKVDQNPAVKNIKTLDFKRIEQYDRLCFPAGRHHFLHAWLSAPHQQGFWLHDDNLHVTGYAVMRQCIEGYKIGPLFANDLESAKTLLCHCLQQADATVFIDIPEINKTACALAKSHQAEAVFACARMYRQGVPDIDMQRVFAITTFELG